MAGKELLLINFQEKIRLGWAKKIKIVLSSDKFSEESEIEAYILLLL